VAGPAGASLATAYDLLMFDLDGVVYIDGRAVAHASRSIARAREAGAHIAFITNNASRTPEQVATHLEKLGIAAAPRDVVTSSQAAARLLLDAHGAGAPISVLGSQGLVEAVEAAGLEAVAVGDPRAVAVVSGFDPDVRWRVIMRAATLIRGGLPWVATNTDLTLPTGNGLAPGHGMLVRLISEFAGVTPEVAGKPRRPLLDETRRRVQGRRPLMVGDRLDTDIAGATEAETDSLLVMTGVSSLDDLVHATADQRPTWIGHDLTALHRPGVTAARDEGRRFRAGPWTAWQESRRLRVEGRGDSAQDLDAWWTAAAAAAWDHLDRTGEAVDTGAVTPPGPSTESG
jgi:glycerol 3-phosphatase-2